MTNIKTPKIIQDIEIMINVIRKYFGENKMILAKFLLSTIPELMPEEEEFKEVLKYVNLSCAKDKDITIAKQVQTAMIFIRNTHRDYPITQKFTEMYVMAYSTE